MIVSRVTSNQKQRVDEPKLEKNCNLCAGVRSISKKGASCVNTWRFFSTASRIVNAEKRMSAMWARDAAVNEFVVAERT